MNIEELLSQRINMPQKRGLYHGLREIGRSCVSYGVWSGVMTGAQVSIRYGS